MTTRINITQDGTNVLKWTIEDHDLAEQQVNQIIGILNGKKLIKRRRRNLSPEELQQIADAWKSAPAGERNKAVRDLMGVSSQDAVNYVTRCRAKGLIEPSEYDVRRRRRSAATETVTVAEQSFDAQFGVSGQFGDIINARLRGAESR